MSTDVITPHSVEGMSPEALFPPSSSDLQRMPSAFDNVHYRAMSQPGGSMEAAGKTAGEWHAQRLQGLVGEHPAATGILLDIAGTVRPDLDAAEIADLPDLARQGVFGEVNRMHSDPSDIANAMFATDQRIKSQPEAAEAWRQRVGRRTQGFEATAALGYLDDTQRSRAQGEVMRFLYGKDKAEAWGAEQDLRGRVAQEAEEAS